MDHKIVGWLVSLAIVVLAGHPQASSAQSGYFRDCSNCPELTIIPAGQFRMGSPTSELGHTKSEEPLHEVTIARPFAIGKYEVTRFEFSQFIADSKRDM